MKVIGIAGWSGAGKTTLLTRVIPLLAARGWRVSTIKHAHHQFDVDQPGKDSHTHREAGATEVLVSSANRFALMHELRGAPELTLHALLGKLSPVDLVLVEGFKRETHPKLEVFRAVVGKPMLHPDDPNIVAVASDGAVAARVPVVVDGFICSAAALAATRIAPAAAASLIASHRSVEAGHRAVLKAIGQQPLLDLDLRLGEGTGAVLAMNLVDAALAIVREMATFASAGVSDRAG